MPKVVIDHEACVRCDNCLTACELGIFERLGNKIIISNDLEELCINCGVCITECPEAAITLEK